MPTNIPLIKIVFSGYALSGSDLPARNIQYEFIVERCVPFPVRHHDFPDPIPIVTRRSALHHVAVRAGACLSAVTGVVRVRLRAADLIRIDVSNLRNSKLRSSSAFGIDGQRSEKVYFKYESIKRLSSGARANQRLFELFMMRHLPASIDCRLTSPALRIRRWQRVALVNSSLLMACRSSLETAIRIHFKDFFQISEALPQRNLI